MKSIKQLSAKILNSVKAYCKRVKDLQDEIIKFNNEYEKQMRGDKK